MCLSTPQFLVRRSAGLFQQHPHAGLLRCAWLVWLVFTTVVVFQLKLSRTRAVVVCDDVLVLVRARPVLGDFAEEPPNVKQKQNEHVVDIRR